MPRLAAHPLPAGTTPARPDLGGPPAAMGDPALTVMTDFTQRRAIRSLRDETAYHAEQTMRTAGVRLLFVVDGDDTIKGIVSYRDLVGQRALATAAQDAVKRTELSLAAIMTPAADVEVLDYSAVADAQVNDVIELMRERGRQHALVVDTDSDGRTRVRGMFSATQIGRQLGITIESSGVAQSFAEFERLLATT